MVLTDELACPLCHGALDDLACSACETSYVSAHGVPSFITRSMYSSDEEYDYSRKIIDFWGNGWEKRFVEPEHRPFFEGDESSLRRLVQDEIRSHHASDSLMDGDMPLQSIHGKTVLNIGAGAGTEALVIASSGAKCIAMDITWQAAQAAEKLIRRIGGSGIGIQADARYIPLKTGSVDAVYSSGVIHHSPDIVKSIAEIRRVLKPGGTAYVMLYATWSILFVQMRMRMSTGETAWETGGKKNPHTTTYSVRQCQRMFADFERVRIRKTGATLKHLAVLGRWLPTRFDRILDPYLGPRLNISAIKPVA